MKKLLKHEGGTYEGIFMPLPGKQNYGHMMVGGILLKSKGEEEDKPGPEVVFGLGRADEVFIHVPEGEEFAGFANLDPKHKIKKSSKPEKEPAATKPIKLNNREDIQAMSKDAEEIIIAMKKYSVEGIVYLKEVKEVNPNKLYGHLVNLEKAKIIKRLGKDKKRGTKIKILR